MEDHNRSQRYRNDNRSSSNERNKNNWDRTYNRSDDWGGYNNENRDPSLSRHERGYQNGENQLNRNYYNDDFNRNYHSDSNRNNFRGNSYRNDYNNNQNEYHNGYNDRYRNEGWRDDYRNEDRNWWDRTRDEVESWFGDDDAKRRRRMDEINEGNHRGKGPKNYTRSQERIKEDVSDKLCDDSFLDASGIEVEVKGNEVTLSGQVDSRYSKHRAEDLAEDVTGVTHVQNNLHALETAPQENRNNSTIYNTTKNGKETANL